MSNPLEIVVRMSRRSAELFRRIARPGFALFPEVAAEAAGEAAALAHEAEHEDRAATEILDEVLRDGVVSAAEIPLLRRARGRVARSAAKDAALAGGGL